MNLLKDIENKLFRQKMSNLFSKLSILPLSLILISPLLDFFNYLFTYFILVNAFLSFSLFSISDCIKIKDIKISELLFYIERNPTKYNKECKELLFKQKIPDLLTYIESIETTLKEKNWFLINKDKYKTKILDYLINVDFLKYLSTLDYETIEKYLQDEIELMKFEKDEQYSNFIEIVNSKKSTLENKDQENTRLIESGITMVKGVGIIDII